MEATESPLRSVAQTVAPSAATADALANGFGRGGIIVTTRGLGRRAGCEDAGIERAPDHHRHARRHASREELVDRALLEQSVASGKEEHVELAAVHQVEADLELVVADAHSRHSPYFKPSAHRLDNGT